MQKSNATKLIEIFTILLSAVIPLRKALGSWNNIYTSDITKEILLILPIAFTIACIVCITIFTVLYLVLDLKCTDALCEKLNSHTEHIRDTIYHMLNINILFYFVFTIAYLCAVGVYETGKSGTLGIIVIILFVILLIEIIVIILKLVKKSGGMKKYKFVNWRRKMFPLDKSAYGVIIFMLFIVTLSVLVICLQPEKANYNVVGKNETGKQWIIRADSNIEFDFEVKIDDSDIDIVVLNGKKEQSSGTDERFSLQKRYYYMIDIDFNDLEMKKGMHKFELKMDSPKSDENNKSKEIIYWGSQFIITEDERIIFMDDSFQISK